MLSGRKLSKITMSSGCRVVRRQDANKTTAEHSACAQQHSVTVEMVEHTNALAETAVHIDIEQRLNLRTRLFCYV